jgi:hypothetical protein
VSATGTVYPIGVKVEREKGKDTIKRAAPAIKPEIAATSIGEEYECQTHDPGAGKV